MPSSTAAPQIPAGRRLSPNPRNGSRRPAGPTTHAGMAYNEGMRFGVDEPGRVPKTHRPRWWSSWGGSGGRGGGAVQWGCLDPGGVSLVVGGLSAALARLTAVVVMPESRRAWCSTSR
jgi:hypothetical protein